MQYGFLNDLDVHRKGKYFILDSPLQYRARDNSLWEIPAGFRTDLASVPLLLPGLVHFILGGPIESASSAALHDYLYSSGIVSRRVADALFYESLRFDDVSLPSALFYWGGVRIGGLIPWLRHRRVSKLP